MTPQPAASPGTGSLHRVLSLTEVTAGGVGIIIGAGIYVLVGAATAEAGASVWLSFVLAAVLCALTGLSYAELGSRYPSAAAEYTYTQQVLPHWVAFLTGWVMILGLVISAATVALGFASYLRFFLPALDARLGALLLLAIVTVVAWRGIKHSARMTLVFSAVQVGGLLLVIGIGLPHVGEHSLSTEGPPMQVLSGVLGASALVFFAYIGFDEVATLSEETRDPVRTVPRALALALGISTLLYVGVAVSAVSVLGAEALAASSRPLADVVAHVLGDRSAAVMAALALVSTTNTCLLALTSASRVTFGMARDAALPVRFARVDAAHGAPRSAIVVAVLVAVGFALVGDLKLIAGVADFAIYLVFVAVNATVILLRVRGVPAPAGSFSVPGTLGGVPVIPVFGSLVVLLMIAHLDLRSIAIGVALLLLGGLAAWLSTRQRGRRAPTAEP